MLSGGITVNAVRFGAGGTHFLITYPDGTTQVMTWPTVGRQAYDEASTAACIAWRAQQGHAVSIAPRSGATSQERNLAKQKQEDLETLIARVSLARARLDEAVSEDAKKKARRDVRQALADIGTFIIDQGSTVAIQE